MKVNQKTEKAVRNGETFYSIPVAFKTELNEKQFHKLLQIRNLKSDLKQEFESSAFIAQLSEVLTDAIVSIDGFDDELYELIDYSLDTILNTLLGITPGVMNNGVQIEINDFERYSMDIWQFTKLGEPVFLKNKGKQEMVILGVEEYAKLIKKTMD